MNTLTVKGPRASATPSPSTTRPRHAAVTFAGASSSTSQLESTSRGRFLVSCSAESPADDDVVCLCMHGKRTTFPQPDEAGRIVPQATSRRTFSKKADSCVSTEHFDTRLPSFSSNLRKSAAVAGIGSPLSRRRPNSFLTRALRNRHNLQLPLSTLRLVTRRYDLPLVGDRAPLVAQSVPPLLEVLQESLLIRVALNDDNEETLSVE